MLHRREHHGLLMHCDHLMDGNGLAVGLFQPKGPSHKPPVGCLRSIAQSPQQAQVHMLCSTHTHTQHTEHARGTHAPGGVPPGARRGGGGRQRHAARLVPSSQELFCVSTDCLGPMYTAAHNSWRGFVTHVPGWRGLVHLHHTASLSPCSWSAAP